MHLLVAFLVVESSKERGLALLGAILFGESKANICFFRCFLRMSSRLHKKPSRGPKLIKLLGMPNFLKK